MIGGSNGEHALAEVERFDPRSRTIDFLKPIPTPRRRLSAAVFDGKIYVVGGERFVEPESFKSESLNTVEM